MSGGPDSMALLYLLKRAGVKTFVVHCNYGLRGKSSDNDQALVEEMCMLWNIECNTVRLDVKESSEKNFQNWARDRRYEIFFDLKKQFEANYIVTAHHQDDQIETLFQRILRGSGLSSWSGMSVMDGKIFRPLLDVSKTEIMEFVQQFNIPYRIDSTNEESTYARNFLRNNWFPELNNKFPGWRTNVLAISQRAKEFNQLVKLAAEHVVTEEGNLQRDEFLSKPEPVQRALFHYAMKNQDANTHISGKFLENINKLSMLQTGAKLPISGTWNVIRDRDYFVISTSESEKSEKQTVTKNDVCNNGAESKFFSLNKADFSGDFHQNQLSLDIDSITFPITIRQWQNGDTFSPLGMQGSQLVSDHLTNRKIPAVLKKSVKVIESFDGTICAVIFPPNSGIDEIGTVSDVCRCTEKTNESLILSYT